MRNNALGSPCIKIPVILFLFFFFANTFISTSQTYCIQPGADQIAGEEDGFRYELWNQNSQGTACMTLGNGALFSGEWNGILNYLARRGLGYNQTQEHQEIGEFYTTYNCDYNPSSASGNSYLSVYGWTVEPLVEYYIIEDWRNWIPSMADGADLKGSFEINGSFYDIYENTRVNQPSIVGNTTFQQYFSIRRNTRTAGTINISDHFRQWESIGMNLGKLHEVSVVVEGYQSNGSFEFTELDVSVDNTILGINDLQRANSYFEVYPNPTRDVAYIHFKTPNQKKKLEIYDVSGKIVVSKNYDLAETTAEISNLSQGMYFVVLNINNNSITEKLIIH
ncbi:glycoside hydrolase family 11 protein [Aquimarina litoralis]|uniref:glycoside hydrolase family 11 protein n=1 Tax=Aquimarina litoralis TaxID=584605 RepID=UPI001C59833A|nr:glycoside hydrolase family 11 protein [Aquimarina litoralis]MBW1297222.1 T9SS type A sorting domain-containing protein [Aquimarina litoralis]